MRYLAGALVMLFCGAAALPVPPKAERGRANADCRSQEDSPAVRAEVLGLKDRTGKLIMELYPANDLDFLAPDKELIAAGKVFRRVPMAVPARGPIYMCIRAPGPGRWAIALLHDRDGNGKFGVLKDGVGFVNNPEIGSRKPASAAATIAVGNTVQPTRIIMNYRRGFSMAPLPPEKWASK